MYKRVEEYTMQYDKYTLTKELGAKGVPVGPVLDWNELENDPDLNEDGTLITIDCATPAASSRRSAFRSR